MGCTKNHPKGAAVSSKKAIRVKTSFKEEWEKKLVAASKARANATRTQWNPATEQWE